MSEPTTETSTPVTTTTTTTTTTNEHVCRRCSKPEAEVGHPLKRCTKCQSVNYCSRDCQKAHWSNHKKACRAKAAERDRSLNNPTKEKILKDAKRTNDLLRACTSHSLYSSDEAALRRTQPTLWNVLDFLRRTWHEYVSRLISPKASAELRAAADPDASDVWPPFNQETYEDIITRNLTIAMIILDRGGRQAMFGGRFDFGDEAKNIANAITSPS